MAIYSFYNQMRNDCFVAGNISRKYLALTHNLEEIKTGSFKGTEKEPIYFFECTFTGEEVNVENCVLVDCKGIDKIRNLINVQFYNFNEKEPEVYVFESERMVLDVPLYVFEEKHLK